MSPDLERIAVAVPNCPAVAGLHGGIPETIVTLLPAGRLVGVVVNGSDLVIGVVGRYPASVTEIADQVRAAVAGLAPNHRIIVSVEDLHVDTAHQTYPPSPDQPSDDRPLAPRPERPRDAPHPTGGRHRRPERDERA